LDVLAAEREIRFHRRSVAALFIALGVPVFLVLTFPGSPGVGQEAWSGLAVWEVMFGLPFVLAWLNDPEGRGETGDVPDVPYFSNDSDSSSGDCGGGDSCGD
jgi:hypothetical protein